MSINVVFQIAAIGVIVSFLVIVLRQSQKDEWAQMVSLAGAALALGIVLKLVFDLFQTVKTMFQLY
ncbi:MAG: stage III sporulation protein AC [Bacillota bacterium]|jgi:stage III sporulation protein AC|nr:MAG: stage III sporulation protein AC [Bacillota bacterium]